MDFLKRLSLIVSTSDQVVHISDITVVVIVHLDIIVDIVVLTWISSPRRAVTTKWWSRLGSLATRSPSCRGGGHYFANGHYELGW